MRENLQKCLKTSFRRGETEKYDGNLSMKHLILFLKMELSCE